MTLWPSEVATYSHLFAKMLDPVLLLNADTFQIEDANPAAETFWKSTRERLRGTPITEFIDSESREALLKALRIARRRYFPTGFQCAWMTLENSTRCMEMSLCSLQLSEDHKVVQVIAKDVSREIEAEEKSKRYLRDLLAANEKLRELSSTDEMTGLANFRRFRELLELEHSRAKRFRSCYALVFCDLDHFKAYNDSYGHPAGDRLLQHVAAVLRNSCRKVDQAFRYGGEEFVILCPHTDSEQALILAQRLRQSLAIADPPVGSQKPTLSIGIASFPKNAQTPDEVLKLADEATYEAKNSGRDRVVVSEKVR